MRSVKPHEVDQRVTVVKSWTERAEGNHPEPDIRYGKGHLEVIGQAMRG